jgi:hypothetical protein
MSGNKTTATDASVEEYLASRGSDEQRADCRVLMSILRKVTKQEPKMWGPSIVGYGSYRYRYESGRTGESCLTGFAIRGREVVVYLAAGAWRDARLSRLGPHRITTSCLYLKRLAGLDLSVLEQLIAGSVTELKGKYGPQARE